ncbi:MAG: N-acetylmuramoyl-L-alanine amidase [Saprospiraceae bacterium]|nr:N-acetylmuramoyl-L-alanine amidase [Saprospiraceae bacterium]
MKYVISPVQKAIVGLLLFFVSDQLNGQTNPYWQARLTRNMTVIELLTKYQLDGYECAIQQFQKINNLSSKNTTLKSGQTVNLPVWIYTYNGKTIRSSIGTSDLDMAKMVQSYNSEMNRVGLRSTTYQSSSLLLVPYYALNCAHSRKPKPKVVETEEEVVKQENTEGVEKLTSKSSKGRKTFAIFGKKYQDVEQVDRSLKGKVFYVEGGHGGPDPGAEAKVQGRTLCEDEYAYDVSLRVARELIKHGAIVYIINRDPTDGIRDGDFLICDSDELTYPNIAVARNHKERLTQRSDAVNLLYEANKKKGVTDQRLIVIHVDSRGVSQQTDTFLYYQNGNEESLKIAKRMQKTLEEKYARYRDYKGTLTTRDLHMLRECKPTTVYVELGNIRNEFDRKRLMIKNNRQAIAAWLAEGFMR